MRNIWCSHGCNFVLVQLPSSLSLKLKTVIPVHYIWGVSNNLSFMKVCWLNSLGITWLQLLDVFHVES